MKGTEKQAEKRQRDALESPEARGQKEYVRQQRARDEKAKRAIESLLTSVQQKCVQGGQSCTIKAMHAIRDILVNELPVFIMDAVHNAAGGKPDWTLEVQVDVQETLLASLSRALAPLS